MFRNFIFLVIVVVFLLAQTPLAIDTAQRIFSSNDWNWWSEDAVTSPERAKELAAKGLREQLLSFNSGMVSLKDDSRAGPEDQRYVIGVGQVTLNEPEDKVTTTGSQTFELTITTSTENLMGPDVPPGSSAVPTYPLTGQFNNVLIFDRHTGEITKLFNKRLAISRFQYGWRTKPECLVIFATDIDSNKDGKLDDEDLQDIYVYTFADRQLHKAAAKNIKPIELMGIPDADYVVVKALYDHDGDGKAAEYGRKNSREPAMLIRVDLKTFAVTPFIPADMLTDLQKTLDGPTPVPAPKSESGKPK